MPFTLLSPDSYAVDLAKAIDRAKDRVDIIALVITEDDKTAPIVDALCRAGERGVKVSVGLDIYFTYKELSAMSSRWAYLRAQVRQMRASRKKLGRSHVKVRWLSQFGFILFSRRTHTKWSIIDSTVYSFGGVNLYAEGINANDFILRTTDSRLAERMASEHELIISTDKAGIGYPSHRFTIEEHTVLIDGGRMFDSIIYRTVCRLASDATRIVYVSQYCPTGRLGRILKKRQTEFYFNSWHDAADIFNKILIFSSSTFHRIQSAYTKKQYLHAKFMLFYMESGEVVAVTGSHNFIASGGTLGTREVALQTNDPRVIQQLENFLHDKVQE